MKNTKGFFINDLGLCIAFTIFSSLLGVFVEGMPFGAVLLHTCCICFSYLLIRTIDFIDKKYQSEYKECIAQEIPFEVYRKKCYLSNLLLGLVVYLTSVFFFAYVTGNNRTFGICLSVITLIAINGFITIIKDARQYSYIDAKNKTRKMLEAHLESKHADEYVDYQFQTLDVDKENNELTMWYYVKFVEDGEQHRFSLKRVNVDGKFIFVDSLEDYLKAQREIKANAKTTKTKKTSTTKRTKVKKEVVDLENNIKNTGE